MQFIQGEWQTGSGAEFMSIDPADDSVIWVGEAAGPDDVDAAFRAARAAFLPWARTPLERRIEIVKAFKTQLEEQKDALAELIARETGKALWEATGEAGAMIGKVDISLKAFEERTGGFTSETPFGFAQLGHKPLGVMFVLGPYNFPGHLPNGHIVPALIAGNTAVFKPSELTPAVGEMMINAWDAAGLPAGVLNMVQGARETGAAALNHDALDGVLFTGSFGTGQFIHKHFAGRTGIQLALEMGGNNPLVIWDAEDTEAAARIAVHSAFMSAGQRCSCARRLILPDGEAGDAIIAKIIDLSERLTIGAWNSQPTPFMGALITQKAAQHVLDAQDDLIEKGAKVLHKVALDAAGPAFLRPGLLDVTGVDVPDDEVFGPLLQVIRVATFDEAIAAANDTAYGLAAGLVSDDRALWDRFWIESRAGITNWNRPTVGAASNMPFGGPGQSGNLRPSAYYAADYCAYPVATQAAETPERLAIHGTQEG